MVGRAGGPVHSGAFPEARIAAERAVSLAGLILLQVTLNEIGRPADIVVLGKGVPLLDGAAIEAVRRWEYPPTLVDGTPRRVMLKTVIEFFLSSKARQQHFLRLATSANEDVGSRLYAIRSLGNPGEAAEVIRRTRHAEA